MSRRGIRSKLCSKCYCLKELSSKRYCRSCSNEAMRKWRKNNPLNDFARAKAITRSKTKVYIKRGLIIKQPCGVCDSLDVQAHHNDYNDPYNITWLCFKCHRDHHIEESYDQWKWKQHKLNI